MSILLCHIEMYQSITVLLLSFSITLLLSCPLTAGQNKLYGTMPSELGLLTNLEVLSLANNRLTGTIPIELGALQSLTNLDLSGNSLTGNLDPIFCTGSPPFSMTFDLTVN